jgi:hypothetical protein
VIERFTKISLNSEPLPIYEPEWSAVLDCTTGLMWSLEVKQVLQYKYAARAAESMRAGGFDGWRLPTIQELWGLCDLTRYKPAMDHRYFRTPPLHWYWSSTRCLTSPGFLYWSVNIAAGEVVPQYINVPGFVRGVRTA